MVTPSPTAQTAVDTFKRVGTYAGAAEELDVSVKRLRRIIAKVDPAARKDAKPGRPRSVDYDAVVAKFSQNLNLNQTAVDMNLPRETVRRIVRVHDPDLYALRRNQGRPPIGES